MSELWYRFEETHWAGPVNEWGDVVGEGRTTLAVRRFATRPTPKGVWLTGEMIGEYQCGMDRPRFVLRSARKRYACPTVKEAAASFAARKHCQISIMHARIRGAQKALDLLLGGKW